MDLLNQYCSIKFIYTKSEGKTYVCDILLVRFFCMYCTISDVSFIAMFANSPASRKTRMCFYDEMRRVENECMNVCIIIWRLCNVSKFILCATIWKYIYGFQCWFLPCRLISVIFIAASLTMYSLCIVSFFEQRCRVHLIQTHSLLLCTPKLTLSSIIWQSATQHHGTNGWGFTLYDVPIDRFSGDIKCQRIVRVYLIVWSSMFSMCA